MQPPRDRTRAGPSSPIGDPARAGRAPRTSWVPQLLAVEVLARAPRASWPEISGGVERARRRTARCRATRPRRPGDVERRRRRDACRCRRAPRPRTRSGRMPTMYDLAVADGVAPARSGASNRHERQLASWSPSHRGRDEVHRRGADEAGDEHVHRLLVELAWAGDLLQLALAQQGDPVAERHGLGLVVGDVDGGDAQAALQAQDLGAHLATQLGVEVATAARRRGTHRRRARWPGPWPPAGAGRRRGWPACGRGAR